MFRKIVYSAAFLFVATLFLVDGQAIAQSRSVEEVEITVLGKCGMCKERIEKAAYSVRGVRRADWNQEEQKLALSYRSDRAELEDIERAIAKAGHDTENFLTDEETHANLHQCCIYERDPEMLENNKLWNEE